ncbi:zinc ribbon domain-containing protein [Endozoicomonas sp.]|uniref:zinc ribbon domain-containing protein n=1 Tax=Endozoicomonas sp. TaxID=1892382 RepID=UPI002886D2AA|nr:zinc ribbon domain-containing protein [Endozoicomonas sp.]
MRPCPTVPWSESIDPKTNNIGYLSFKSHRGFTEPKSIYIRKESGQYSVSFCFDDGSEEPATDKEHLEYLKGASREWLEEYVIGVDRGVAIPVHTGVEQYDFKLETYTRYKAAKAGKAVFKIPDPHTSQECAPCDDTHPDNRKKQDLFLCGNCGHVDNADRNASFVVKKRAIKLLLDGSIEKRVGRQRYSCAD